MTVRETCGSATFIKGANGWLTIFFLANFPPVIWLYLVLDDEEFQSFCLLYLALISIWACVGAHFSAWITGRTEVKFDAQDTNQGDTP